MNDIVKSEIKMCVSVINGGLLMSRKNCLLEYNDRVSFVLNKSDLSFTPRPNDLFCTFTPQLLLTRR